MYTIRLHSKSLLLTALLFLPLIAQSANQILMPAAPQLAAKSYYLEDFDSQKVLASYEADTEMPPASLTKIMTAYVVFKEITSGNLNLSDLVTVSEKAWRTGGSKMFIEVNKQVSVDDLLKGVIIQSGNDACVALAEHIAGNESTFAQLMNQHAQKLGMMHTNFENATGLPGPKHYTSAHDLAILTRALISEFPEHYALHSQKEFTYNSITQKNRNKLLWRDATVDGVKTGHTEAAGYCLVASAKRENMRLISVVMGTKSTNARANDNQALLNYGFRFFETHKLYQADKSLAEARIWKGETEKVGLSLPNDVYITIPRRHYKDLKAETKVEPMITAPVEKGQALGHLTVRLGDEVVVKKPLQAMNAVPEGGIMRQIYDSGLLLLE